MKILLDKTKTSSECLTRALEHVIISKTDGLTELVEQIERSYYP